MTDSLIDALYVVTQYLLIPVLAAVVVFGAWLVVALGGVTRELLDRRRLHKPWRTFINKLRRGEASVDDWSTVSCTGLPSWIRQQLPTSPTIDRVEMLLPQAEQIAATELAPLMVAIRVGPMLGLVGTLIPLGPALKGLSSGDISSLGTNLNIAFTTTICGILIGAMAYAAHVLKRSMYERDLSDLELIVSMARKGDGCEKTTTLG